MSTRPRKSASAAGLAALRRDPEADVQEQPPVVSQTPIAPAAVQPPTPAPIAAAPTPTKTKRHKPHMIGGRFTDSERQQFDGLLLALKNAMRDPNVSQQDVIAGLISHYTNGEPERLHELVEMIGDYRFSQLD